MDKRCAPTRKVWRPIHYLGSKLRVIDSISRVLDQAEPRRGRLCDLFAGSGTVSAAIASEREITAVDIQEYSRVLCSALLRPTGMTSSVAEQLLNRVVKSTLNEQLKWATRALIDYENHALDEAGTGRFERLFHLIELGPLVNDQFTRSALACSELTEAVQRTRNRLNKLGYAVGARTVVLRHFGGLYFSYRQAMELTVLLDIAAQCTADIRNTAMAAVLSTTSEIVNTVGKHFAQPIRPHDGAGRPKTHLLHKIVRDRSMNAFAVFSEWLERYRSVRQTRMDHRVLRADYIEALNSGCRDVSVVYADPPYTRDHYSRYYHVLETMCLRDDPEIATSHPSNKGPVGRACYRIDRHQSPFCIKSQAPKAFEQLFAKVRKLGVPLVLSYSPLPRSSKPRPRVMAIEDISTLAFRYFKKVDRVAIQGIAHNKLNTTKFNSNVSGAAEILLICS